MDLCPHGIPLRGKDALLSLSHSQIGFGVFLACGSFCSVLPQNIKICLRRTSLGINHITLFLAVLLLETWSISIVILKLPQFVACGDANVGWNCQPSLLTVYQVRIHYNCFYNTMAFNDCIHVINTLFRCVAGCTSIVTSNSCVHGGTHIFSTRQTV